jgi:hypothetical protein
MPANTGFNREHLPLPSPSANDLYKEFWTKKSARDSSRYPPRPDAQLHGSAITRQVERVKKDFEDSTPDLERWKSELAAFGLILEIEGKQGYDLAMKSFDTPSSGMRLLRSDVDTTEDGLVTHTAITFIEHGKVESFLKKIADYAEGELTEKGKHQNQDLVSGIENIRLATLKSLWNDGDVLFPEEGRSAWWECWIRKSGIHTAPMEDPLFLQFDYAIQSAEMTRGNEVLSLPEQFVVLVKATPEEIAGSVPLLNTLQELRRPKNHAAFFRHEHPREQRNWAENLDARVTWPSVDAPAVCIIDTGVNNAHPLLNKALADEDCDAYDKVARGVHDEDGHGTEMAGLSLFGDLAPILADGTPIALQHRLESVKMIPTSTSNTHDKFNYPFITQECMDRPETWDQNSQRPRVYCLTITAEDDLDRGRPSAWSAALDAAILNNAQGASDAPRLVCVSGGNIARERVAGYPNINDAESCHDPAQAWNVITVGAYTEKDIPDHKEFPGWQPLAQPGTLSPASTTGYNWNRNWPIKPDIVMEGGNYMTHPEYPGQADTPDNLQLLTTHYHHERMFSTTGDTSAAVALAARYCAILRAEHPRRWPETIRALLIHSAEWTPQMTKWKIPTVKPSDFNKTHALALLQRVGYGVPNLERANKSANNSVVLIAEEVFQPYSKERGDDGKLKEKTKGYHRYRLPIPSEELQKYHDKNARMRVTLSYFIDPNPTNPEVKSKFRYQGTGLRFEIKGSTESDEQFFSRLNKLEALPKDAPKGGNDSDNWLIGADNRSRGSLHSDTWYGNASELATKDCLAVYPVGGWWKLRPALGQINNSIRFSLIISIEIDAAEADIYSPIEAAVSVQV